MRTRHADMAAGVRIALHAMTDVGLVRPNNEDNFLILDLRRGAWWTAGQGARTPQWGGEFEIGEEGVVLAVSDGMGGAVAGEVASSLAVTSVAHLLLRFREVPPYSDFPFSERVRLALEQANRLIYDVSQQREEWAGMGATFTTVAYRGGEVYLGQVGDSRAYGIRAGRIRQLTKDQSLVTRLVEAGVLTEEQAERHMLRNVILQALGAHPHTVIVMDRMEIRRGDHMILCSDGLSNKVSAAEMAEIVLGSGDLAEAAAELVRRAKERGGDDNITVLVARFMGDALPEAHPEEEMSVQAVARDERLPDALDPELWRELTQAMSLTWGEADDPSSAGDSMPSSHSLAITQEADDPSSAGDPAAEDVSAGSEEVAPDDPPEGSSAEEAQPERPEDARSDSPIAWGPRSTWSSAGEDVLTSGVAASTVARALLLLLLVLIVGAIVSAVWYFALRGRESPAGPLHVRDVVGLPLRVPGAEQRSEGSPEPA